MCTSQITCRSDQFLSFKWSAGVTTTNLQLGQCSINEQQLTIKFGDILVSNFESKSLIVIKGFNPQIAKVIDTNPCLDRVKNLVISQLFAVNMEEESRYHSTTLAIRYKALLSYQQKFPP